MRFSPLYKNAHNDRQKEVKMIRVTIIGASGYAGAELIRILANHKECEIAHLVAKSQGGKSLGEVFPSLGYLTGLQDVILEDVNAAKRRTFKARLNSARTRSRGYSIIGNTFFCLCIWKDRLKFIKK